jgi:two-component system KDP operon response regulator KdpE
VVEAADARAALGALGIDKPELVLLDLGLPDRDGLELVPLIKCGRGGAGDSARDATAEKVAALDLGADDYVTKPFDTEEVLARVRVALRNRLLAENAAPLVRWRGGDRPCGPAGAPRWRGGASHAQGIRLSGATGAPSGRVVTHAAILRAVWGPGQESAVEYLRVAACGLRRKLEDVPVADSAIRNEPGWAIG